MAAEGKFKNVIDAFAEIAAADSGYLTAAEGAYYWASFKSAYGRNPSIPENNLNVFYALCGF